MDTKGLHLLHGDNRILIPTLSHIQVDVVFADPPYGVKKAHWDQYMPRDWFYECMRLWPDALYLIKIGAGKPLKEAINLLGDIYQAVFAAWLSNGMTRGEISFGNWIPIVIGKREIKWEAKQDVLRLDHLNVEKLIVRNTDKVNHPTPAPPDLMRAVVKRFGGTGQTWLDPFMGSGTTGVACIEAGINFIGIEQDQTHYESSKERIDKVREEKMEHVI